MTTRSSNINFRNMNFLDSSSENLLKDQFIINRGKNYIILVFTIFYVKLKEFIIRTYLHLEPFLAIFLRMCIIHRLIFWDVYLKFISKCRVNVRLRIRYVTTVIYFIIKIKWNISFFVYFGFSSLMNRCILWFH